MSSSFSQQTGPVKVRDCIYASNHEERDTHSIDEESVCLGERDCLCLAWLLASHITCSFQPTLCSFLLTSSSHITCSFHILTSHAPTSHILHHVLLQLTSSLCPHISHHFSMPSHLTSLLHALTSHITSSCPHISCHMLLPTNPVMPRCKSQALPTRPALHMDGLPCISMEQHTRVLSHFLLLHSIPFPALVFAAHLYVWLESSRLAKRYAAHT